MQESGARSRWFRDRYSVTVVMSEPGVKPQAPGPRRPYRSPKREAAALKTRQAIRAAADRCGGSVAQIGLAHEAVEHLQCLEGVVLDPGSETLLHDRKQIAKNLLPQ